MRIIVNLKQPRYLLFFVGITFLAFDVNFFLMKNLPGSRDNMCVMGANFTLLNIGFALVLSLLIGLLVSGFVALFRQNMAEKKMAITSLSGIGAFFGMMTVFCTACTIPVLSLFGLSIGLEFFTDYNPIFKIVSIGFLLLALYQLNRQLNRECAACDVLLKTKSPS